MYVPRDIEPWIARIDPHYPMLTLVGMRQAGKTTLLQHMMAGRDAVYLSLDDPDIRQAFDSDVKTFERKYLAGKELAVLDEVHYGRDAGLKLKYLADSGRKMWVTASSEVMLGKDVLSHLVGRTSIVRIHPFSMPEFLRARNIREPSDTELERSVWEHATYGGYPRIVITDDPAVKRAQLADLRETMLLKDVAGAFSIDDTSSMELMTRYLAANAGGIVNIQQLSNTLKLSVPTVKKYLNALEKSYFIRLVKPHFTNRTKELVKAPKAYFMDTGMRNVLAKSFSDEIDGRLFENYIFTELVKMGAEPKYWSTKSGAEVDFVIESDGGVVPVEVKLAPPGSVPKSLRSFIDAYHPKKAFIASMKRSRTIKVGHCPVHTVDILGLWEAVGARDR